MGKIVGVIERWNPSRGFGFLKPEDGGEEVFFHASEFKGEERDIRNGDSFEFEIEYDKRKGKDRAMNVVNTSAPGGRDRSRSRSRGGRGGRDESVDSRFEDDLKDYIKDNDLDESAEDRLRACPPSIAKKVIEEGDLKDFRNPSSMVMSRISNAKGGGKGRKGEKGGSKGKGRGRGRSRSYDRYDRRDRSYDRGNDRRDRSYSRGRDRSRGRY